jgi:hypothetical protein
MVTLIMSKFSLVGAESALVKLATLWSDGGPMGQRRNVTGAKVVREEPDFRLI